MKQDDFTLPMKLDRDSSVVLYADQLFANWGFGDGDMLEEHPAFLHAMELTNVDISPKDALALLIKKHLLPALPAPLRTYQLQHTCHNPIRAHEDELNRREEFGDFSVSVSSKQIAEAIRGHRSKTRPRLRRRAHAPQHSPRHHPNPPNQQGLPFAQELIIDNFAGGGGTSTGLEAAFGRPVDIAINHDPEALAMHAINHPLTRHLCESVWDVDPIAVTGNQPVALVWLSPDCKHFSKAKGGTPVAKHIRGLAWVGMRWVALCKPRVLMLENVEEFKTWGPLIIGADGQARPDPVRKGRTFDSFVRQLRQHGYQVAWKEMRACDHDTPTIRKRLFLVARRDGLPIVFPDASNAESADRRVLAGNLAAYRTAAECIDFSLPTTSIFDRPRPLATNTQRRLAKGLWRHVLTSPNPFIVETTGLNSSASQAEAGLPIQGPAIMTNTTDHPGASVENPLPTITTGGQQTLASATLTPYLTEHANSSNQRTMPADEPLRTVCAQVKGGHFSVVSPAIVPMRGTSESHLGGHDVRDPLSTISAGGTHHGLMAGHITKFNTGSIGTRLDDPLSTITAGGTPKRPSTGITQGLVNAKMVAAHIQRDMGKSVGHAVDVPLATTTAGGSGKSTLIGTHLLTIGYGEREGQMARTQDIEKPLGTVVAANKHAVSAIHLTHLTHHGERSGHAANDPLPTITAAHRGEQAIVAACLEQANGGFYDGDGRPVDAPISTITAAGSNQRLISAYMVKYYGEGGQSQCASKPMHTLTTKDRMGLVQVEHINASCISEEHLRRARMCAALLREHLPEHFSEFADIVLIWHAGAWWILVDITLRMLKPRELFRAQGFPENYVIHEIPDPKLLFDSLGHQVMDPLMVPRIPLSATAQVRMCGNSVCPPMAKALAQANFSHESLIYDKAAA